MAEIRITDMPALSNQEGRDIFAFQRQVAGVWTDFYTNFDSFGGELRVAIHTVDLSVPDVQTIFSPAAGEVAFPVDAFLNYTPDASPSGTMSLSIDTSVTTIYQWIDGSLGSVPILYTGGLSPTGLTGINTDLLFTNQSNPGTTGTVILVCTYIVLTL